MGGRGGGKKGMDGRGRKGERGDASVKIHTQKYMNKSIKTKYSKVQIKCLSLGRITVKEGCCG